MFYNWSVFVLGAPATTSASTTGFSLGFNKPAGSATPFALPITSTSAGGLSLSSALTSTPAAGKEIFAFVTVNCTNVLKELSVINVMVESLNVDELLDAAIILHTILMLKV